MYFSSSKSDLVAWLLPTQEPYPLVRLVTSATVCFSDCRLDHSKMALQNIASIRTPASAAIDKYQFLKICFL